MARGKSSSSQVDFAAREREFELARHAQDINNLHKKIAASRLSPSPLASLDSDPLANSRPIPDMVYFPFLQLILQGVDITRDNIPFIPSDLIKIVCEYLQNTVQDLRILSQSSLERLALVETNQLLDEVFKDPHKTFGILPAGSLHVQVTYVQPGEDGFAKVQFTRSGPPMNINPTESSTSKLISSSINNCSNKGISNPQSEFTSIFSWSIDESRFNDYSTCDWYVLDEMNQPIFCWRYVDPKSDSGRWEGLYADQLRPWLRKLGVLPSNNVNSDKTIQTPVDAVAVSNDSTSQLPERFSWIKPGPGDYPESYLFEADAALTLLDAVFQAVMMGAGVKYPYELDSYYFLENWNPQSFGASSATPPMTTFQFGAQPQQPATSGFQFGTLTFGQPQQQQQTGFQFGPQQPNSTATSSSCFQLGSTNTGTAI